MKTRSTQRKKKWLWITLTSLFVLMLLGYALILAARKSPKFYRDWQTVSHEKKIQLNSEAIKKTLDVYAFFEKQQGPWGLCLTDEEINAWLAVGATSGKTNLVPREFQNPCLKMDGHIAEFAARVQYGKIQGTVYLVFSIMLSEPDQYVFRLRSARLGIYPLKRAWILDVMEEQLKAKKIVCERINDNGDDALKVNFSLPEKNKKKMIVYSITTETGQCFIEGIVTKEK